jgi:hypothetical protein
MPKKFNQCVAGGGRVRTVKPKGKRSRTYIHVCYPRGGGSPVAGEVKKRRKK